MLQVFSINGYALLDPSPIVSFLTPLVSRKFNVLPDVLIEPFSIITPMGDSVVAKRAYISYPIIFPSRVTLVDLVELDILYFNVILGMDWLHDCFASIDYRKG